MSTKDKNIVVIETHNGKAHIDEVIACGMIKAYHMEKTVIVLRVEPTLTKRDEFPDVEHYYYVDKGLEYDGVYKFDHHQDDPEMANECAATLVARHLFPDLLTDNVWAPFLERIAYQDNHGLRTIREGHEMEDPSAFFLMEWSLVETFEVDCKKVVDLLAHSILNRLSARAREVIAERWFIQNHAIEYIDGHPILVILENSLHSKITSEDRKNIQRKFCEAFRVEAVYDFYAKDRFNNMRFLALTNLGMKFFDFKKSPPKKTEFIPRGGGRVIFTPTYETEWMDIIRNCQRYKKSKQLRLY